jgi:hypothetical protein
MQPLWLQEVTFLILLFLIIFIVYNTISFFLNKTAFKKNMKLSLKYIGISLLLILSIPVILILLDKIF